MPRRHHPPNYHCFQDIRHQFTSVRVTPKKQVFIVIFVDSNEAIKTDKDIYLKNIEPPTSAKLL